MPTAPNNHELHLDLGNWFTFGSQAAHDGDLRQALFAVSVIAALLSQQLPSAAPTAPTTQEEILRRETAFSHKISTWKTALRDLMGVNGGDQ